MSRSSEAFYALAMDYTSTNEIERKEHKCILATCGIWKDTPQQSGKFVGTGSLIKDFFPKCDKIHLVTSDKVISPIHGLSFYSLYFKRSNGKGKEPKKLVDMVSDEVIFKSGLAIVPVDPNKLNFKRKRTSGLLNHRPFTICTKVKKDLRNDELYCHVIEGSRELFAITPYQVKGIADKETYIADDSLGKIESSRFYKDYRKGLGAPITITVKEEAVAVGAITLGNNEQISFVLFSQIDRTRICSDSGTSLTSSSSKDAMQQETVEQSVDQATPAQDGGTSMTSSSSKDARQQETFEHSVDQDTPAQDSGTSLTSSSSKDAMQQETFEQSVDQDTPAQDGSTSMTSSSSKDPRQQETFEYPVDQDTPAQGNMSLSSLGNSFYEVSIEPGRTPLKGEGSCWFTFNPDLPSDITSGSAKFFGLGSIDLKGVKHTTNCFVGRRIPNADEEGWVTVEVFGKSDNTGKSSYLGQTQIYYYNNEKEVLKKIVQDEEQRRAFFESWKTACKGYSTDSREKETKSPSSGCMNSGNPLHSVQGLLLLVYAAAETDAREFIELVFNSLAGKVVFNAYRYNSPLPEDVARAFGYEDTAQYLESISKRLSEDLSANEERLEASHISELAEAVKNQSKSEEQQDHSSKKDEGENGSVFKNEADPGIPQEQHVPRETTTTTTTKTGAVHSPCQETGDDINYKAKSGYVLVINNYIFPMRPDGERHWSGEDVKGLKSLFDDFNFTTKIYDNLEQREIKGLLQDTSEKDFGRYDCFVCVILSHVSKDGIYGTDNNLINIEAITSCFCRNECPSLEGKPKIFLIQACRGTEQDRLTIESNSEPIPCTSSSLPADADFLICFASAPNHQSYRQPEIGSWFISAIVDVFKKYAEREHLMDMMLRVNDRVANFLGQMGQTSLKQIPCQVCMLRRKVFFNPTHKTP